jgi:hypothetical protein
MGCEINKDGKKGGNLVGNSHKKGGIKAKVVDTGQLVELEGGEVIINKKASEIHHKELSKINQSAGNGVPILPPNKITMEKGGNIEFETKQIKNQSKQLKKYTHFAIHKPTKSVVFNWDYKGYDKDELKSSKDEYFWDDIKEETDYLVDKWRKGDFEIIERKNLSKKGIDLDNYLWFQGQKYKQGGKTKTNMKGKALTISAIKKLTAETSPHFFDRDSLKFFGQKMSDFKVTALEDGRYRISAPTSRIDSSGNKVTGSPTVRYYNPENNELERSLKTGGALRTNSKVVMDKVKEHILESVYDENEEEFDTIEKASKHVSEEFKRVADYDNNKRRIPNNQDRFQDYLQGIPFNFEYEDYKIEEFLNGLGINPSGKEYSSEQMWKLYSYLIWKEVSKKYYKKGGQVEMEFQEIKKPTKVGHVGEVKEQTWNYSETYSKDKDKARKKPAMKPGKRISKSGNVYYETRINRSDVDGRKRYGKGGSVSKSSGGLFDWMF